jgi:hypothetical protein
VWDDKAVRLYSPRFLYIANLPQSNRRSLTVDATHNSNSRRNTLEAGADWKAWKAVPKRQWVDMHMHIPSDRPIGDVHNLLPLATVCLNPIKVRLTFSTGESGTSFWEILLSHPDAFNSVNSSSNHSHRHVTTMHTCTVPQGPVSEAHSAG